MLQRAKSNIITKVSTHLTTRSLPEPGPPPDGGLHAWTQVAMGWIVLFVTWGYTNSFGTFQAYYEQELLSTLPPSTISWIGSVQVWFIFFVGAFSGRLLDAGLFVPTFMVGCVCHLLGIFLMSLSTKYWQLMLTQGVLTGLGGGIFFCPCIGLVATYFSKRRAIAVGLATTGNSVGGMIYPILSRELLPRLGFAWTTRILGFMNMAGLVVCLIFMRPRLPPRPSGPLIDLSAWRESMYTCFVVGMMGAVWSLYFVLYYLAPYGADVLNMPFSSATILVLLMNGCGIPTRIIPALIAQRVGPLNVLIPAVTITALLVYCWAGVTSSTGLYAFAVVYGLSNGSFQCLLPTTVASLTKHLNMVGTRLGMCFSALSFAALTGGPVGGAIISAAGGDRHAYICAIMWAAAAATIGAGIIFAGRIITFGWRLRVKC